MPRAAKPIPEAGTPQAKTKANATTWKPGQSGNPSGNAKNPEARAWLSAHTVENLEGIMDTARNSEKEELRLRAREFLLRLTIAPPAPEQQPGNPSEGLAALAAILQARVQ